MAARTLIGAANKGDVVLINKFLDEGWAVNKRGPNGYHALAGAVESGNYHAVKTLLDRGARLNLRSEFGWTPIYQAVNRGYSRIAHLLLKRGAKPDVRTKNNVWGSSIDGDTALHGAIRLGNFGLVRALVCAGAKDSVCKGWTAVDRALFQRNYKMASYLLLHGFKRLICYSMGSKGVVMPITRDMTLSEAKNTIRRQGQMIGCLRKEIVALQQELAKEKGVTAPTAKGERA